MGLLFPECFKTTPVVSHPQSYYHGSRTSSTSSAKTLVDINSDDDEAGSYVQRKIYQTLNNQYIVTTFVKGDKSDEEVYDENTDTEEEESQQFLVARSELSSYSSSRLYTLFACRNCHNHICISNFLISNNFTGRSGELYLVSNIINFTLGMLEKKKMLTGSYDVCDVNCKQCGEYLGWKYLKADSHREKYKMGKYVIEKLLFEEINVLGG